MNIKYKSEEVKQEWWKASRGPFGVVLGNILIFIVKLITLFISDAKVVMTDVWRNDPKSAHYRLGAFDLRVWIAGGDPEYFKTTKHLFWMLMAVVVVAVNLRWQYDPKRPRLKVCMFEYKPTDARKVPKWVKLIPGFRQNPGATGFHFHIQTHHNTIDRATGGRS